MSLLSYARFALGILCLLIGYLAGSSLERSRFETYKASLIQNTARSQIQITHDYTRLLEDRNRALQSLTTERDALLGRLRNRPSRPTTRTDTYTGPETADPGATSFAGCGPEQLYRENAEDLARLSADAEQVRLELLRTRESYDSIRQAVGQ